MLKLNLITLLLLTGSLLNAEQFFVQYGPEETLTTKLVEGQDGVRAEIEKGLESGSTSFGVYLAIELDTYDETLVTLRDTENKYFGVSWVEDGYRYLYKFDTYLEAEALYQSKKPLGAVPYGLNFKDPVIETRTRFVLPPPSES